MDNVTRRIFAGGAALAVLGLAMAAAAQQPVKIGFRSEHFAPADEEGPAGPTMPLELPIQFVEKSGAEAVAFLDLAGKTIAARVEPGAADRYRRSATAAVKLQLDKVNVFDAGSGRRL